MELFLIYKMLTVTQYCLPCIRRCLRYIFMRLVLKANTLFTLIQFLKIRLFTLLNFCLQLSSTLLPLLVAVFLNKVLLDLTCYNCPNAQYRHVH